MLDGLHVQVRRVDAAQRLTLLIRTVLAAAFVAPGLTKVLGIEFAPGIEPGSLMGAYFRAFHAVGPYYTFVGAAQVVAGLLLLSRRTALLGAVLYFPTVLNIAVLTVATRFGVGTPVVTVLMTLGCLWLLLWDGHRLVPVLAPGARLVPERPVEPAVWDLLVPRSVGAETAERRTLRLAYVLGLSGVLASTLAARGLLPLWAMRLGLVAVAAAALLTLAGLAWSALGRLRARASA